MISSTLAAALLLLAASPITGSPTTGSPTTGSPTTGSPTTGSPTTVDTYPRQTGFRVVNYSFTVLLSDASNELVVTDTVNLAFTADGVTGMDLDLCQLRTASEAANPSNPCLVPAVRTRRGEPAAPPVSSVGRGMVVTSVTSAGQALHYTQANDRLHVVFPAASRAGGRITFAVSYHGVPATGILIADNKYGDRSFVSNPWPDKARNWLAVVDHPYMKAPKTIAVTAPAKYQVISNGTQMESTDLANGLRRTVWKESVPIATWQYSLAAAPYAVDYYGTYHGIPMSGWTYPQEQAVSSKAFGEFTQPILEFYIDHIGPYSYEKLAQVEANGIGGGMELASDIFYGYPATGPDRQLLAHEMAHQWFGNSATEADWDDVWLSEGFATYFALLYQEHQDGRDAFIKGVKSSAASARRYAEANPTSPLVHNNLSDISKVIANNAQIYQGGAQVLHMLRGVLGTDNFWAGIRLYYSRYQNSNASSLDFQHAMEDACAAAADCPAYGKDLSWFFPQWLHRGGVMKVNGSWHYDAASKQLAVTLDQTPNQGQLYTMPFQIGIEMPPEAAPAGSGARTAPPSPTPTPVLWVRAAHNTVSIPLASAPVGVTLDPEIWVTMVEATFVAR
ncbi:MAG: M1 family metallopeptidase [Gemmatimonadota bacterium]